MPAQDSIHILQRIRRNYIRQKALLYALQALAGAALGSAILYKWGSDVTMLTILAASLVLGAMLYFGWALRAVLKINLQQVARHLNHTYPQLEESAELLLKPEEELNLLERLQRTKVASQLQTIVSDQPQTFQLKKGTSLAALSIVLLVSIGILYLPAAPLINKDAPEQVKIDFPDAPAQVTDTAVTIQNIEITITPPAYTGKKSYKADNPNLRVEQGATVSWNITTNKPATQLQLVLNETNAIRLSGKNRNYTLTRNFAEPAIYHLNLDGQKSAYYTIEIIPDEAPVLQITRPEQYTEILFGDPQRVTLQAKLSDDYGLRDANMIATVAKGTGEAVKFREEKISLGFTKQTRNFNISKTIDLKKLGMTYGDELYFYVQAWDNHRGYTRSETYFVQIEDTTIIESMSDLSMGVNPVPEYFRSQRQIIIDTEKLLAEQKSISRAAFEERSNNLGVDQKLLRLRYGKFLGEEFESGIGPGGGIPEGETHHADDGHDHPETSNQNDPQTLLDPYMHKHDQEDEATIFEPAVKARLKGALAQMWEAELRLRTHRPKDALPFEYKALRMLKEVQQSTRAYVAKTGFEAPPLKEPELRLTGELTKITAPSESKTIVKKECQPYTKAALQWLAKYKVSGKYKQTDAAILEKAGQELARQALNKPGSNLKALQDLRTLIAEMQTSKTLCSSCLISVERAWVNLLPPAEQAPQPQQAVRSRLSEQYLKHLNKK